MFGIRENKIKKDRNKAALGMWIVLVFLYYNYLLLANMAICSATIIPIEAIIGNNNEFN